MASPTAHISTIGNVACDNEILRARNSKSIQTFHDKIGGLDLLLQ